MRVAIPGAIATAVVLGSNLLATGDARSAGAQLKLLSSNPYLSEVDRARVFVENLVTLWVKVVRAELSTVPGLAAALLLLAFVGLASRAHRVLAGASLTSAVAWALLVSWNGNAPYHNFRYYAPALILLPLYYQLVRRESPLDTGLLLVPQGSAPQSRCRLPAGSPIATARGSWSRSGW